MPKPNTSFHLTVEDLERIERSLIQTKSRLLQNRQQHVDSTIKSETELDTVLVIDTEVRAIRELLGRLHNQKTWYRPKDGPYISG